MQEKTTEQETMRTIYKDDEIWDPTEKDENDEPRGKLLTIEEQMGVVELELSEPLKLSDREEPVTSLQVKGPSAQDIKTTKGTVAKLIGRCVMGIVPRDLDNLNGRDYLRIQGLLRHFLA